MGSWCGVFPKYHQAAKRDRYRPLCSGSEIDQPSRRTPGWLLQSLASAVFPTMPSWAVSIHFKSGIVLLRCLHFSPSAPACGVLQNDPNDEDQSYNNPDLNPELVGPFPTFHFSCALIPIQKPRGHFKHGP